MPSLFRSNSWKFFSYFSCFSIGMYFSIFSLLSVSLSYRARSCATCADAGIFGRLSFSDTFSRGITSSIVGGYITAFGICLYLLVGTIVVSNHCIHAFFFQKKYSISLARCSRSIISVSFSFFSRSNSLCLFSS